MEDAAGKLEFSGAQAPLLLTRDYHAPMNTSFKRLRCVVLLAAILAAGNTFAAQSYYLSERGEDSGPGTLARPWRTLERASKEKLQPGDQLLLARGSRFVGTLVINDSGSEAAPITVSAYGKGAAPRLMNPFFAESSGHILEVLGSHVRVERLYFHDTPTPTPDAEPTRWQDSTQHKNVTSLAALFVGSNAHHVTIEDNEFVNAAVGIRIRGSHARVAHNYLHDAGKITEQWGAIAIAVVGPYNEVCYNHIENYGFYGGAYVDDGAAVELDGEDPNFAAHTVHIHHNLSRNVKGGFLEVAAGTSHDILVEYNVSDDVDKFVGASRVQNVTIRHNTVIRTRLTRVPAEAAFPLATVFWSFNAKGTDTFHITDNLFVLNGMQRLYQGKDHPKGFIPVTRRGNQLYSPDGAAEALLNLPLGDDSIIPAPRFADPDNDDYRLLKQAAGSPYAGAFAPDALPWRAGPRPLTHCRSARLACTM